MHLLHNYAFYFIFQSIIDEYEKKQSLLLYDRANPRVD